MYNAGQKFLLRQYLLLIVSRHMSFFNQIFCRGDRKYSWLENFLLSVLRPIQFWLFGYKAPIFICRRHSSTNILPRSDSIWRSKLMHSHNFCRCCCWVTFELVRCRTPLRTNISVLQILMQSFRIIIKYNIGGIP